MSLYATDKGRMGDFVTCFLFFCPVAKDLEGTLPLPLFAFFPLSSLCPTQKPPISLPSPSVGRLKVLMGNLLSLSPTKKGKPSMNSVLTLPSGTKASLNRSKNASSLASVLSFPTVNGTFFIGVYLAMGLPSRRG